MRLYVTISPVYRVTWPLPSGDYEITEMFEASTEIDGRRIAISRDDTPAGAHQKAQAWFEAASRSDTP